jgi:hypothetical protein
MCDIGFMLEEYDYKGEEYEKRLSLYDRVYNAYYNTYKCMGLYSSDEINYITLKSTKEFIKRMEEK